MVLYHIDSLLVMLACTVAGGIGRPLPPARPLNATALPLDACPATVTTRICEELDATIEPWHILSPWICTLSIVLFLGMPTVLLQSRAKEAGLQRFAASLVQFLGLLASISFASASTPVTVRFVFALHACVRFLVRLERRPGLVGGTMWWGLRYAGVAGIVAGQTLFGPPVSLIVWPVSGVSAATLSCAHLSHLVGCVAPELVLALVRCVIGFASFVDIRAS